ncbi:MAG TPA: hypothetical protein VEI54_03280, partial [Candidatus Limnocylindrales bacterium]|nr:hypothetical protein [Candidatus Limnocylindrales bacterium]
MFLRFAIPIFLLLSASADLPHLLPSRAATTPAPEAFPPDERIPLYPIVLSGDDQGQGKQGSSGSKQNSTLQESSKLNLIRYVSGEFAKARKPIPGGKEGFTLNADKALDEETLNRAVTMHGAAINTGDNVQITKLEFHEHSIIVDVNGGGRPRRNWKDHLQIGIGGPPMPTTTTTTTSPQDQGPPGFQQGRGGTIYLQFSKNVPDLSPDDLKSILAPFLDFSKERSASVHWIETLPPEMKKAITERRAVIGMDREEVVAALGKPDRKVRERDPQGNDTEDWIYGHPP